MADFNPKKLQVFVSSTFDDLKLERQAAVEAILMAGHIPAGMELFTASDESQMDVIKQWIDESDVYLLMSFSSASKTPTLFISAHVIWFSVEELRRILLKP